MKDCRDRYDKLLMGTLAYDKKNKNSGSYNYVLMYRVMGGKLYYDWPWGRER
jgi:hypothetical protein